ncbi:MAG: hypothetical protein RL156_458 [Bacteroidota bacterium]
MTTSHDPSTSSAASRAATGAGILFLSQIVGNALYFLTQRTIISEMPKESFGALAFVQQSCSLLLVVLVDAGLNNVAIREMLHHPDRKQSIVASAFWLRLLSTVAASIVIAVFFAATDLGLLSAAIVAVVSITTSGRMSMLRGSIELPFRAGMNYRLISLLFVLDIALYAAALWMYTGTLTPVVVLGLQFVCSLPGLGILFARAGGASLVFPLPSWQQMRDLIIETRSLLSQLVMQNIHAGLDIFILRYSSSLREVAVFGAVANISVVILTLYSALSTAVFPLLAEKPGDGNSAALHQRILRSMSFITFSTMVVAACLSVCASVIISVFTKNVYADHLFEFRLQFWCTVLIVMAQFTIVVSTALKEHRAVFTSGVMLVVGSLLFDFVLIPPGGTRGMLLAKMLSNMLALGTNLYFISRVVGRYAVVVYMLRTLTAGAILYSASMFLSWQYTLPYALLLTVALSGITGFVLKMITRADVELIRGVLAKITSRLSRQNSPASIAQE